MPESEADKRSDIIGSEKVTAVFGWWPRFEDAEVVSIQLHRQPSGGTRGPTLEAVIYAFEMRSDVDSSGHDVLGDQVLIHLRFSGVSELKLEDFNHQNALYELKIRSDPLRGPEGTPITVTFDAAHGMDASFRCLTVEVVSVRQCDEEGSATA